MRLFVAINFPEEIKDGLRAVSEKLKNYTTSGTFTTYDNLHLTLVFIGETQREAELRHAMDTVESEPFTLKIEGLRRFKRDRGDIYWIGIERSKELLSIYEQLTTHLAEAGFHIEAREYKPHVTLGREVSLKGDFNWKEFGKTITVMETPVAQLSLMKSERINGKLCYTSVYEKSLENRR